MKVLTLISFLFISALSLSVYASEVDCATLARIAAVKAHNEKYPEANGTSVTDIRLADSQSAPYTKILNKKSKVYVVQVAEENQEATWLAVTSQLARNACHVDAVVLLAAEH